MILKLDQIAKLLNGKLKGDANTEITGVGSVEAAGPGRISFVTSAAYAEKARASRASAMIVADENLELPMPLIVVDEPFRAFIRLMQKFHPQTPPSPGIHPSAVVAQDAVLGRDVSIGALAVIDSNTEIRDHAIIGPGCVISERAVVGEDCRLYPQVTLYQGVELGRSVIIHSGTVIGADGFGYLLGPDGSTKIPQVGKVIIEDNVEIGANCTIDRAALDVSRIGAGTKLDNQVHLAHGVVLGKNCIVLAQTGIGGSTKVGDNTLIAGGVIIKDNVNIGSNVSIVGKSGVMDDIPDGQTVWGIPSMPFSQAKRVFVRLKDLPELFRRVKKIERRLFTDKDK